MVFKPLLLNKQGNVLVHVQIWFVHVILGCEDSRAERERDQLMLNYTTSKIYSHIGLLQQSNYGLRFTLKKKEPYWEEGSLPSSPHQTLCCGVQSMKQTLKDLNFLEQIAILEFDFALKQK